MIHFPHRKRTENQEHHHIHPCNSPNIQRHAPNPPIHQAPQHSMSVRNSPRYRSPNSQSPGTPQPNPRNSRIPHSQSPLLDNLLHSRRQHHVLRSHNHKPLHTPLLYQTLLHVSASSLRKKGEVSVSVAAQMALGVLQKTSCRGVARTWGISTTGVADPEGQDGMISGVVYLGIAHGEVAEGLGPFYFEGERSEVKEGAVLEALVQLRKAITSSRQCYVKVGTRIELEMRTVRTF